MTGLARHRRGQCYRQLRAVYRHDQPVDGRGDAEKILESFHTFPVHEVARLGRSLRAWRTQFLAYFDTGGANNGGTEAIDLIVEKILRLAHRFPTPPTTHPARRWQAQALANQTRAPLHNEEPDFRSPGKVRSLSVTTRIPAGPPA
ncbi:transposase [Agromyces mariniharenae]|uniref:transposase n=1 Tax=Agromyces mariniharenae TaxID=2604423 RepID=UPI00165303A5|nr:transposase [Agromyces mariniharenae]